MIRTLFVALFAACALATQAPSLYRPSVPVKVAAGQSQVYEYSWRVMTGIPNLGDQFAGLELQSRVQLVGLSDQLVLMKMTHVRLAKHHGPAGPEFPRGHVTMQHEVHAQFERELTKPVRFVYANGKVKAFEADQSEPEWSLNMKKALLALFNLDLQPKKIIRAPQSPLALQTLQAPSSELTVFPVYEEGVGGICETVYELHNAPYRYEPAGEAALVLNVTKTKNYDNCLTEPSIANDNFDVRGCPWVCRKDKSFPAVQGYFPTPDAVHDPYMSGCPCGKEPHESPVDAYSFAKYNISLIGGAPTIEGVYQEGKVAYGSNGDEILVITQQNLTLFKNPAAQDIAPIAAIPRPKRHNELSFRIPKPELPVGYKLPLDIPYYHLFGQPEPQELKNLIPELISSLADQIAAEEVQQDADQIGQKSVQVVNAMAVLSQHALQTLFEQVAQQGASLRATPKQQIERKLFLDALPLSGSNDAALAIKSLILEQKVTASEAQELVEAVPQNLFLADTQTIDQYLELFQAPQIQAQRHLAASAGIAFGKMVKEACVKRQTTPGDLPDGQLPHPKRNQAAQAVVQATANQQRVQVQRTAFSQRMRRSVAWEDQFQQEVCGEEDVQKYVTIVARLLAAANSFHQKVVLIETLAHMGVPHALEPLEPYISGHALQSGQCPGYSTESGQKAEECNFVRAVAIYALAHVAEHFPKQVAPLVLPVYSDPAQPYELRIAAFTTLIFSAAEKPLLERIASELQTENNRQVRAFVTSALNAVANMSAPCFQHVAQHAQYASEHAPQDEPGYQYSRMVSSGFFDQNKDFGLYSMAEWTQSNISRVPRAGYLSIGQSSGPFQDELLQLGFQAKGVEALLERALQPQGIIAEMFESMRGKAKDRRVNKRSAQGAQEALAALKNDLKLEMRADDEPKATVFFKLLDRTSYYALDKHYLRALMDRLEDRLKDAAAQLMTGQQLHYVKLWMPAQLYKVVPSEVGLPVVISHRHPLIISVKIKQAKLLVDQGNQIYPLGANISAQITPAIFYSSQLFAFALNPSDRQTVGVNVQKTTHAQFPVEVSVGYSRPKNLITWSLIPQIKDIVFHETKAQTFAAKAAISGAPDGQWLEDAQPIKVVEEPFQHETTWAQEALGLGVRVRTESEDVWSWQPVMSGQIYEEQGLVAAIVQAWRNPGLKNRRVQVALQADEETPVYGYDFTLRYKTVEESENGQKDEDDSDESSASDESDSDQSDESSASKSSESNDSQSNSESNSEESSESSSSSEQSNESNESKNIKKNNNNNKNLKKKIARKMKNGIVDDQNRRKKRSKETNESSDESSNESGSKSFSKSGSKQSSQSSSSESQSSEEKRKNGQSSSSESNESSESSSSSSSESDESKSMEDAVFDYQDVMQLILGQEFQKKTIKKITKQLIQKTSSIWSKNWDDQDDDSSSEDESQEPEVALIVPQTIATDIRLTAVARGPRPAYYALNILYARTFDGRVQWLQSAAHAKAPKGVYVHTPEVYCADAVVSFPKLPNEFYYEPQMASARARLQAQVAWGQECRSQAADGGIIATGVMEQTEEHVIGQEVLPGDRVKNWFGPQCEIDRQKGLDQSFACQRAIEEASFFNQIIVDVKYKNIGKQVKNLTRKADLALKTLLYDQLDLDQTQDNPEGQLRAVAQYSSRAQEIPLFNLELISPEETARFQQIHAPYLRPISRLLTTYHVFKNLVTGYDAQSTCHVMAQHVRTFDNVTFEMPSSACQYLVAKDCSAQESFAVFAQALDEELKTKTAQIVVGGHVVKLTPPLEQTRAQIMLDGKALEVSTRKPVTIGRIGAQNAIRVYIRATPSQSTNPIVVVEAEEEDLEVLFDGQQIKIIVGNKYAGRTCGLCGDNNQEAEDEFSGPRKCIYEEPEDFARAYQLTGEHCEAANQEPNKGNKICPKIAEEEENSVEGVNIKKSVIIAQGPNGQTIVQRQQVAPNAQTQKQAIEARANIEELQINAREMQERQMARNEGTPIGPEQTAGLILATPQQQKLIQRLATKYIERDEMFCFSTKPQLSCISGARAINFRSVVADFHCLPKNSPFTRQLIQEAQTKVIKQLINKRVDLRQAIQVPVACID